MGDNPPLNILHDSLQSTIFFFYSLHKLFKTTRKIEQSTPKQLEKIGMKMKLKIRMKTNNISSTS
jgi:hypothetical protein